MILECVEGTSTRLSNHLCNAGFCAYFVPSPPIHLMQEIPAWTVKILFGEYLDVHSLNHQPINSLVTYLRSAKPVRRHINLRYFRIAPDCFAGCNYTNDENHRKIFFAEGKERGLYFRNRNYWSWNVLGHCERISLESCSPVI